MSDQNQQTSQHLRRQPVAATDLKGLVYLFEIFISPGSVLRFIDEKLSASAVSFAGENYNLFSVSAHGFSWSADGPPVRPMLYLSNSTGQFTHEIFTDRLRGNHVRRIITLADELDPPHGAGGANCFPVESWVIDRIAQLDNAVMRLELTAEASFEGVQFPQRVMLRDLCQHSYRRWRPALHDFDYTNVTCPYTNRVYFTNNGTRTTDPSQDACSFHLGTGCRKRFGGDLPFLGFPGVRRL